MTGAANRTCRGLTETEKSILTTLIKRLCLGDVPRVFNLIADTVDIHRVASIWDGDTITCNSCGKQAILFDKEVTVITHDAYSEQGNPKQLNFPMVRLYKCPSCKTINVLQ